MADQTCPRCKAHDDAVPTEAQLRLLIIGEDGAGELAFVPRAMNAGQALALQGYGAALTRMIAAFGIETTGARVNRSLVALRCYARVARVLGRIDQALEPGRAEIFDRFKRGEVGPAEANDLARALRAPDYEGRDRDEAFLQREFGVGVDAL